MNSEHTMAMKRDNLNYLFVGCFVFGMTVLLLAALFRISGRSADTVPYYVNYKNITGIHKGSKVTFGGYQIGVIDSIVPFQQEKEMLFRLKLALRKEWKIPMDSYASIIMPAVLSEKQIDILPGKSLKYLVAGDTITGKEGVDLIASLNSVAIELQDLSQNNIKPVIASFGSNVGGISKELQDRLPEISKNLNLLLEKLTDGAEQFSDLIGANNQKHLNNVFNNADKITENLLLISEDFSGALVNVDELINDAQEMISENDSDIRNAMIALRESLELVSQNINSIVYNLEGSSRNINEFSRDVRENPGVLLGGRNITKDHAKN